MDIKHYKGIYQFGPAYAKMLENDPHHQGTVDRILLENMVRLCPETAHYLYGPFTPLEVSYRPGSRPVLEKHLERATGGAKKEEKVVRAIINFFNDIALSAEDIPPEKVVTGGKEENIIERKTDWCTDLARAACAIFQVAGFPARMVYLFDTGRAYSGHAIIEVFWGDRWGALDPTYGLIYLGWRKKPVSVWELKQQEDLIRINEPNPYPEQFKGAALANYFIWDAGKFNYREAKVNQYYRAILEMAEKGWPGGLRWLFNEDK